MMYVLCVGLLCRAEKSFTHRHLCEFTGLDLEMAIFEHYNEVLDIIDRLFVYMFNGINSRCGKHRLQGYCLQMAARPHNRRFVMLPFGTCLFPGTIELVLHKKLCMWVQQASCRPSGNSTPHSRCSSCRRPCEYRSKKGCACFRRTAKRCAYIWHAHC